MTRRPSTVAVLLVASAMISACTTTEPPSAPASADQPTATAPATAAPTTETERLLAMPPDGWVATFASNHPGARLAEYAPAGETAETWVEKVSFESFVATPLPDPIEMLMGIAADQKKTCTGFTDFNTFSGTENGYPTSIRLFVCRNNALFQQGQVTLVKAIRGNEQFYVVTRARRVPPIESETELPIAGDDMAAWSLYLRAISVCDASRADHPCPSESPSE